MRKNHRLRWTVNGIAIAGVVALAWWGWVPPGVPAAGCRLAANGAWISVDWTSHPVDEERVAALVDDAARRRIRYLFPFTTYVKADGSFSPSYDHAEAFVQAARRAGQEVLLLAWIGVPLENFGGSVDLADVETREQIVEMAATLVAWGFDGVHLDVERVTSGNAHFLLLLDEAREAIGPGSILSVAGSYLLPGFVNELPQIEGVKWDGAYYRAVAGRVDQIAVMTYDSTLPLAPLYRLWMREQVRGLGDILADADVDLLVGVSVSREKTSTHRPAAENLQSGLAGICAGLSASPAAGPVVDGVAVYAAWEADAADWVTWEDWLGEPSGR